MPRYIAILFALPLLLSCNEEPVNLDCGFSCDDKTIKTWYKKKFGEPITEFELLTTTIEFNHVELDRCYYTGNCNRGRPTHVKRFNISISKTTTGAYAEYFSGYHGNDGLTLIARINMEEWLSFIRTLYKNGFIEWGIFDSGRKMYYYDSGKEKYEVRRYKILSADIEKTESDLVESDWHKFEKIIKDMNAKIKWERIWNGTTDIRWYFYDIKCTISVAEELARLAELVNQGHNFKGKTVVLTENIMLNDTANWQNWESNPPQNKWIPIGTEDNPFIGTFDGNGKVIGGIYIDPKNTHQSLFGDLGSEGIVKNLGIVAPVKSITPE